DPDDAGAVPGRLGDVSGALSAARAPRRRPVHHDRHRRRGRAGRDRVRARAPGPAGAEARDLRRARRRSRHDRVLREGEARLRLLLALSRADRPSRGRAGGFEGGRRGSRAGLSGARTDPLEALRGGGKRAMARALAQIEAAPGEDATIALLDAAFADPRAHVVGITGPPGVGKSSLVSRLIALYRAQERTVGVIAIDPSSRTSGGALLGDRTRLQIAPDDPGIFV